MLKTNSKEFMTWLKGYVINNTWEPETDSYPFKTIEEAAKSLADQFAIGSCENEVRANGSLQEAFVWWTRGLPNPLFDFWAYGDTIKLLGDALHQTNEERAKYSDEDACRLLCVKIWMIVHPYFRGFKL